MFMIILFTTNILYQHALYDTQYTLYTPYTHHIYTTDLLHLRLPVSGDGGAVRDLRRGVGPYHLLPTVQRGVYVVVCCRDVYVYIFIHMRVL